MVPAVRRSNRQRQANKKYQNDLLEKETLRLLRESSESSRPTSADTSDSEQVASDIEFDSSQAEEARSSAGEDDNLSLLSDGGRELSETSEVQTPNEYDGTIAVVIPAASATKDHAQRPRRPGPQRSQRAEGDVHSRGGRPFSKNASKESIWAGITGPSEADVLPLLFARDQWKFGRDVTFPSRKSLVEVSRQGLYGNASRFGIPVDALKQEATACWSWLNEESGDRFRKCQQLENLGDERAQRHIACTTGPASKIVMGPTQSQQAYHLAYLDVMDYGLAWERGSLNQEELALDADTSPEPTGYSTPKRYREGWLLNIGSRVQCLTWAPNRHESSTQYLAISSTCSSAQRNSVPASKDRRAPAFRPSPPYPSSIQIWAFSAASPTGEVQKPNMRKKPKVVQVLCTDWGNIRQLQWCPVLRETRETDKNRKEDLESTNLGLLAVLSSDGHARVLDVSVPRSGVTKTQNLYVQSAAFDATSTTSLYTCVAFVSPTDLFCGTASGLVDIYNILLLATNNPTTPLPAPHPYLTTQQSLTYILSLSPAYPSIYPNYLASISSSSVPMLTDLRSPGPTDRVHGKYTRIASKNLAYSPHLRSYLYTTDGDDLSAYPIRRFWNGVRVARFPQQGSLTTLATSRWHPCVLMGTTSGTVSCANILRRVQPSSRRGTLSGAWVQKLCEFHWIPDSATNHIADAEAQPDVDDAAAQRKDFYNPPPNFPRPGTARFHDGFRAEKQDLSSLANRCVRKPGVPVTGSEAIYEEEQAVSAAEWNPNLSCAGWVAIGWGAGWVRVEDVAHDGV